MQYHEANLVVSGMQETEGSNENTQSLFLDLCKDTLLVDDLQPSDLVEMVRLGRSKKPNVASAPPRAILVKTRSRAIKAKIMARGPHLWTSGIFLNDDISVHEQKARRALVPIFKEFRSANIRCRLDRACLIVGQERFLTRSLHGITFQACVKQLQPRNHLAQLRLP